MGKLLSEKCELVQARVAYQTALEKARLEGDTVGVMEAMSGLLRLAGEALDTESVQVWEKELDAWLAFNPEPHVPMVWYCKGAIERHRGRFGLAQKYFHEYMRRARLHGEVGRTREESWARGWAMLAVIQLQRGKVRRAQWMCEQWLKWVGDRQVPGVNGVVFLTLGKIAEQRLEMFQALQNYQKAHRAFLAERNWYSHLYVLLAYGRLERLQNRFSQADFYLDLVDQAASSGEYGAIRRDLMRERERLRRDAIDLVVDPHHGIVRTREAGDVRLGKQFVLMNILEALTDAHRTAAGSKGLTKAQLIRRVWGEDYQETVHDNKLYYNINRLRRLIEPDVKKPKYLLNWKKGYRLAPDLKVRLERGGDKNERKAELD